MSRHLDFKFITAYLSAAAFGFAGIYLLSEHLFFQRGNNHKIPGVSETQVSQESLTPAIARSAKSSRISSPKFAQPGKDKESTWKSASLGTYMQDAPTPLIHWNGGMLTQRNLTNKAITILQIGDSHTAADFFTGVLRRILQDRFGNGGPGYVIAGHPHIGVRSDTLKVNETAGWSYQALQKSDDRTYFALAGFNAVAGTKGMSMSFSSDSAIPSDVWEVEAVRQPGGGTINIRVDGVLRRSVDLNGPEVQPVVIRLDSSPNTRELRVTTEGKGPILISSVAAFNKLTGLTYNSVGFPGATVNVVNKFDTQLLSAELRRIRPQIVVLAFGTNEGFDDNLDLDRYARNYELVISKVQTALPKADIVIIGPPDAGRRATHCRAFPKARACSHEWLFRGSKCGWSAPPKLSGVRKVQRDIAKKNSFPYWDWAGIMPAKCGAHEWVLRSPPLMAKDHVHFSREGYRISAEAFSEVLIPMIERYMYSVNAISNNL